MLNTKRYTWRHNNLINFIVNNVDKKFKVFRDLPGWEAPGGGTIPPHLCVTKFKPDIVIIDTNSKNLHIFELTCPLAMNIDKRNQEKSLKYAPFVTDITGFVCSVNFFEISSTGFVNTMNKSTLAKLHTFIRKDMKKSVFLSNLNSLAWYGRYQIWLSNLETLKREVSILRPSLTTKFNSTKFRRKEIKMEGEACLPHLDGCSRQ